MPKRLRLVVYKEDDVNYRYRVHGANPSFRGRVHTSLPMRGASELAAIKGALQDGTYRLKPFIANLKVVP